MENYLPEHKQNTTQEHTMKENITRLVDVEKAIRDYFGNYELSQGEVGKMIEQVKSLEFGKEITLSDPSGKLKVRIKREDYHHFEIMATGVE